MFYVPSISVFMVILLGLFTMFAALAALWMLFLFARLAVMPLYWACYRAIYGRSL